jgi:RNA polymerase sigma factor (sigma-70 family)
MGKKKNKRKTKVKKESFEKILRTQEKDVYRLFLYFLRDESVAADLTHQAFISLYFNYEKVDPGAIRTYLFRMVRNMSYNWVRDNKKLRNGQIEELTEECARLQSVEDVYLRKEEMRLAKELADSILEAVYEKSPSWYDMIVKAYFFNMNQNELAEDLGVTHYVISSRLYRAKTWIRENFSEEYEKFKDFLHG